MNKKLPLRLFQGLLPMDKHQIAPDVVAGLTLTAIAIPEIMGYSKIAGMPVITGIYTMLIPAFLFSLFGSSRHLVVGADSATAAILATGLTGLAAAGSPEYVAYAGLLALMVGAMLVFAWLVRLGFLADFLSRTVLIGFLTGVGLQVAMGQIAGMLGVNVIKTRAFPQFIEAFRRINQINLYTLGVSIAVLLISYGFKKVSKKIPGGLIAVIGAIIVSRAFDLSAKGVQVLGTIPGGLPAIGLPTIHWQLSTFQQLLPTAIAMVIVILTQSAATSRAYAQRYQEHFSENADLIGLALSNFGASISGTFVVNGSPTKTQIVDSAGGRSQLAQLTMAGIVILVLGFLTGPLAFLPDAVLSAVVFLIGLELVDLPGMRKLFVQRKNEFWVAVTTAAAVIFVGVEQGIILAIFLSLLEHTRRGYRPKNTLIKMEKANHWQIMPVASHAQIIPGLLIYRFNHSLYYANCELFYAEVFELVSEADPRLEWFCLDATAIDDIDFSAAETFREVYLKLAERSVRLVVAGVSAEVRILLSRYGLIEKLGEAAFYETFEETLEAYQRHTATRNTESGQAMLTARDEFPG